MASKKKNEHATSLIELVEKHENTTNPVTRSVYRSIIAGRLGITSRNENKFDRAHQFMKKLTYSFESRHKMERYFEDVK